MDNKLNDALDRLEQALAYNIEGPEVPLENEKRDLATVRQELQRLREERDEKGRAYGEEALAHNETLERAEAAEAEVRRLTALKGEVVELSAKLERGLLNASAEIVRLKEGLRDLLDAFPMDDPYGSLWTEYRAAQDKARALLAGDGIIVFIGSEAEPDGGGA